MPKGIIIQIPSGVLPNFSGEYTLVYKVQGVYRMSLWVPADQSDPYGTTTGNTVQASSGNEVPTANMSALLGGEISMWTDAYCYDDQCGAFGHGHPVPVGAPIWHACSR